MQQIKGRAISKGIAQGSIFIRDTGITGIKKETVPDTATECIRLEEAVETACSQLEDLYGSMIKSSDSDSAEIFKAQQMLLKDKGYTARISGLIKEDHLCAEYAVITVCEAIEKQFAEMPDEYIRERSTDIREISSLLIKILKGGATIHSDIPENAIIASETLSASEIAGFDRHTVIGFICENLSENSHAAILIRAMNLPALTGITINKNWAGRQAVILSDPGLLAIDPDNEMLKKAQKIKLNHLQQQESLNVLKGTPAITKSGRQIRVFANIGNLFDLDEALDNDAEGVGLMRSEFLYLESRTQPAEEELFNIYKTAALKLGDKPLIIRTADLGSDKKPVWLMLDKEDNPALGLRGIRLSLKYPDMFRSQLRAIYRASAFGNISIMFPMIISSKEVTECKKYAEEVRRDLENKGIAFNRNVRLGIMIETPAAALISDVLAKEVDFLSIGTNDLVQYTLASDRSEAFPYTADTHHPAVLELIRMTIENGHKYGAEVGICGEMAADTTLTPALISYGIDEMSVSPASILPLKSAIINTCA